MSVITAYIGTVVTTSGPSAQIITTDPLLSTPTKVRIDPGQSVTISALFAASPAFTWPHTTTLIEFKLNGSIIHSVSGVDTTLKTINTASIPGGVYTILLTISGSEDPSAAHGGPFPYSDTYTLILLVGDIPDVHLVTDKVCGWNTLQQYNSSGLTPTISNVSTYKGWCTPIAAANVLSYLSYQNPTYFPRYVTDGNLQGQLSFNYQYPSWRNFTLDNGRPARNATIDSFDQTDFGWWMNSNTLGDDSLPDVASTFFGTSIENTYTGLDNFYSHIGYANAVFGINKVNNTIQGTPVSGYTSGVLSTSATYKAFLISRISIAPFIVTLKSKVNINASELINNNSILSSAGGDYILDIVQSTVKSNTAFHHDGAGTDPLNITSDLKSVGSSYVVIGYVNPSSSTNPLTPSAARNKFLVVLKSIGNNTGGVQQNIFVPFDTKLNSGDPDEITFWDALLSTHIITTTPGSWIIPRIKLQIATSWNTGACTGIPKTISPLLVGGGTPADNRFTNIYGGSAVVLSDLSSGILAQTPPYPLVYTFPAAGVFSLRLAVSDGVSSDQKIIFANISDPQDPEFGIIRPGMTSATPGPTITVPINVPFWMKDSSNNFVNITNAGIVITKSDGSSAAGLYNFAYSEYGNTANQAGPQLYAFWKFGAVGSYHVTRYLSNGYCVQTYTMTVIVETIDNFIDFDYSLPTIVGTSIAFTDTSPLTTSDWLWDFGDGNSDTSNNPSHTYLAPSTVTAPYYVTFTALTDLGYMSVTKPLVVYVAEANADFYYSPTIDIVAGVTQVFFYPVVSPADPIFTPAFDWDFGDGIGTSTLKYPSYIFPNAGTYTVTLVFTVIVSGSPLTDTISHDITIDPAGLYANSTTIIIPRNISHSIDLRDLASNDNVYAYEIVYPDGQTSDPNLVQGPNDYDIEFTPDLNYVGVDSYRYKVVDDILDRVATGKVTYIIKKPELELMIGDISTGFSVLNNPFGDYDVSFGSVELGDSDEKTFILKNIGEGDLYVHVLTLIGDDIADYQLKNESGTNITEITDEILKMNEILEFKIEFTPSTVGRKKVRIKIDHN